jgi:hypothetical protein
MHFPKIILFAVACISILFTGCATMFHGKPDLEIVGPPDIKVENANGGPLMAYRDEGGMVIQPNPALTDSLRISYENQTTTVALAKNPNPLELLNFFSYGVGCLVDDLSHSWFNYAPVYVTIDSGSRGVTGISASSVNWIGETPGDRKVDALVILGVGFTFQLSQSGGSPLPVSFSDISNPWFSAQAGLGIDYNKQFDLFYQIRTESGYALDNNNDASAVIDAGDVCLRYFFQKNLFIQGSFGQAYATDYGYDEIYNSATQSYASSTTPTFSEVGVAVGWVGDLSYISLQYFGGLSSFNTPDYTNVRYHTVYLNFGLNFRL